MMSRVPRPASLAAAGALVLASLLQTGCAHSDPARFYVLEPTVPADAQAASQGQAGLWVERLPDYLRRPELVTRCAANELAYDEFSRWATPLDKSVPEVLASNLARVKGWAWVPLYPWNGTAPPALVIRVRIARFEADNAGKVTLVAYASIDESWREETIETQAKDTAAGAIVAAQSQALAELARRIAPYCAASSSTAK